MQLAKRQDTRRAKQFGLSVVLDLFFSKLKNESQEQGFVRWSREKALGRNGEPGAATVIAPDRNFLFIDHAWLHDGLVGAQWLAALFLPAATR